MTRDLARSWIETERAGLRNELRHYLKPLRDDLDRALEALDEGERLPESIMQHSAAISAMIGRWNLARDVAATLAANEGETRSKP